MSQYQVAVVGVDAVDAVLTSLAGVPLAEAENKSKWDVTTRFDGNELAVSIASPHWGAREGTRRRQQRMYKNDVFLVAFDLSKDAQRLQQALNIAKRYKAFSLHRDHAPFYLVGLNTGTASNFKRSEMEELAAQNGLVYTELAQGGASELLQGALRKLGQMPKKPAFEELLNPDGVKA